MLQPQGGFYLLQMHPSILLKSQSRWNDLIQTTCGLKMKEKLSFLVKHFDVHMPYARRVGLPSWKEDHQSLGFKTAQLVDHHDVPATAGVKHGARVPYQKYTVIKWKFPKVFPWAGGVEVRLELNTKNLYVFLLHFLFWDAFLMCSIFPGSSVAPEDSEWDSSQTHGKQPSSPWRRQQNIPWCAGSVFLIQRQSEILHLTERTRSLATDLMGAAWCRDHRVGNIHITQYALIISSQVLMDIISYMPLLGPAIKFLCKIFCL